MEGENPETVSPDPQQQQQEQATQVLEQTRQRAMRMEALAKDLEKKLEKYSNVDLEELKALKDEKAQLEREAAKQSPEELDRWYAKKEADIRRKLSEEMEAKDRELEELRKQHKTLLVTDKVMAEIGKFFNDDTHKFLRAEVEAFCDMEDGQIIVKDEKGTPMYSRKAGGGYMTAEEWGQILVEKYPSLAKRTGIGGSKESGQKGTPIGRDWKTIRDLNATSPNPGKDYYSMPLEQRLKLSSGMSVKDLLNNGR